MSRTNVYANFYATTALGLCLVVSPLPAAAQSPDAEDLEVFVPLVQECLARPSAQTCQDVGVLVQECADHLDYAACAVLFEAPDEVFADPAALDRAQELLRQASAALGGRPVEAGGQPAAGAAEDDAAAAEDLVDDIRADAERTLLRGDENLMVHSPPPLLEGEAPDEELEAAQAAQAAQETETQETEPQETAEEEPGAEEPGAEEPAGAPAVAAEAPEEETAEGAPVEGEAPREEVTQATPLAPGAPEEDMAVTAPAGAEAADHEAAGDEAAGDELIAAEPVDEAVDEPVDEAVGEAEDRPATAAEDARALQAEREQLREQAEAMAEEAPELIVEEAPDEFVAPVEEAPQLGEAQQREIERLLQDPEIAASVALLGEALAALPDDDGPEQRQQRVAAAIAALQQDRDADSEADAEAEPTEAEATEAEATGAAAAEVIEDQITAQEVRRSGEDFASRLMLDFDPRQVPLRREGGRDLERAGLAALAGLAVGMMIERNRVVARADDRVVVDRGAGDLAIWRDDDVILRQEGATRRIERYKDGSTLTRWHRPDGSQVITIRDATGRVLWRERILADGTSVRIVDDLREVDPIDVTVLPPPRRRELRITQRTDPELALAMLREAEAEARALDRTFTLRQIRDTYEVRQLVPLLSPEPITFETNRANVRPQEVPKLMQVGRLMERLLAENPREVFLIEGHTDATGPAAFNLALSDRRAESVALALTEYFDIPPENLVIQGYGERHLRIPTLAAEERNRRVAIRRITPLLGLDI